jgi:hypothetical protein
VPYFSRGDIDRDDTPIRGSAVWVDVRSTLSSCIRARQVEFDNGERVRVGYKPNGYRPASLAALIQRRAGP